MHSDPLPWKTLSYGRTVGESREGYQNDPCCNFEDENNRVQKMGSVTDLSNVVSRDYTRSRAWALRVYERKLWAGIRWWSYYDSMWASLGLWETGKLTLTDITPLTLDNPNLLIAGRTIARRVTASP